MGFINQQTSLGGPSRMELHNMQGYSQLDGLKWKIPTKIDDLGVPPFMETSINILYNIYIIYIIYYIYK